MFYDVASGGGRHKLGFRLREIIRSDKLRSHFGNRISPDCLPQYTNWTFNCSVSVARRRRRRWEEAANYRTAGPIVKPRYQTVTEEVIIFCDRYYKFLSRTVDTCTRISTITVDFVLLPPSYYQARIYKNYIKSFRIYIVATAPDTPR